MQPERNVSPEGMPECDDADESAAAGFIVLACLFMANASFVALGGLLVS